MENMDLGLMMKEKLLRVQEAYQDFMNKSWECLSCGQTVIDVRVKLKRPVFARQSHLGDFGAKEYCAACPYEAALDNIRCDTA